MKPSTLKEAQAHAERDYPREACGLVIIEGGKERYVPCRNTAIGTDHFALAPEDYAAAEDRGDITVVVHSHPDVPATPSQADRVSCEASGLPWTIISVMPDDAGQAHAADVVSIMPEGYQAPLVGREFAHGVLDCYTLVRDWYRRERDVDLPDFERHDDWWHRGEDLYMRHYAEAGFRPLAEPEAMEAGDVIVMQVRAAEPNHAGVYLGDGRMLHHLHGRLSTRDVYGGYWADVTRVVLRYQARI
jgi:proteasome lid subunit RPN8/RPN11